MNINHVVIAGALHSTIGKFGGMLSRTLTADRHLGCRILVTLLHEMVKRVARRGVASLYVGGGRSVMLAVARQELAR